jgi:hypothetical protein
MPSPVARCQSTQGDFDESDCRVEVVADSLKEVLPNDKESRYPRAAISLALRTGSDARVAVDKPEKAATSTSEM